MNAPAKIRPAADPNMIAFAEALARMQVKRDIAALRAAQGGGRQEDARANGHLRPLQQR
ncbi:hypothetical protein [Sphingobium yanoikuyae]|jgi:hypothetical protein|uniref:hypothetical protein n=1 Tax=Sphingobium yanoikuyae TaxID=13690 RepID=UPI00131F3551|nr:hypothetical protein [Sphingobium yanoikuyae]